MITSEELFKIGFIKKTHGVAGELEMRFTDDVFDRVDADYVFIKLDGHPVPFFIESYRFKNDEVVLIKFEDVDTSNAAGRLCGAEVLFPTALVEEHTEAPLTWNYLTGFKVFEATEGFVGVVASVEASSANIVLCVERADGREALLPFHEELMMECDEKKREITLKLPEGLITLND